MNNTTKPKHMEFVIIDSNQAFVDRLQTDLQNTSNKIVLMPSAKELAGRIAGMPGIYTRLDDTPPENPLHIFINIEGDVGSLKRQQQKEAEIIIWLRCAYKVANPIIAYGFQNNAQLLKQKPENLVINSSGCYYIQLPFDFKRLAKKKLKGVTNWQQLKQCLLPAFSPDKLRHREANKWGFLQLQCAHQLVSEQSPGSEQAIQLEQESIEELIFHFFYGDNTPTGLSLQRHRDTYEKVYKPFFSCAAHKKFTIWVIDDYTKWHELYKKIFQCEVVDKSPKDKLEKFIPEILNAIDKEQPDLVLLDLRLYEEVTIVQDPENYSGTKVLKAIKTKHMALPVIITTASNKVQNYKTLLELGCASMWTKEGIDLKYTRGGSLMNYFELLEYVYKVASKKQTPVEQAKAKTENELFFLDVHIGKEWNEIDKQCRWTVQFNVIIADETILSDLRYLPSICLLLKLGYNYRKQNFRITKEILSEFFSYSQQYINSTNDDEHETAVKKDYILFKLHQWGYTPAHLPDLEGINSSNQASGLPNGNDARHQEAPEATFSPIQEKIRAEIVDYCEDYDNVLLLSNNKAFHTWVTTHIKQTPHLKNHNITVMSGEKVETELNIRKLIQPSLVLADLM